MIRITLNDEYASYEKFLEELTSSLAPKIAAMMKNVPKTVCSQREAYRRFGVGNVRRWKKEGRLKPFAKRPGKIEYRLTDLRELFNQEQDYFSSASNV